MYRGLSREGRRRGREDGRCVVGGYKGKGGRGGAGDVERRAAEGGRRKSRGEEVRRRGGRGRVVYEGEFGGQICGDDRRNVWGGGRHVGGKESGRGTRRDF